MIRVCVLGDSHVGAVMQGARLPDIASRFQTTCFGVHVDRIRGLVLSGQSLVPDNDALKNEISGLSGGRGQIDFAEYDRFVIVSEGFWNGPLLFLYRDYASDSMRGPVANRTLLSDACFLAAAEAVTEKSSHAFRLARDIRSACGKPIFVLSAPNPGDGLAESDIPHWYPPFYQAVRNGDDEFLAYVFREICARVAAKTNTIIIPPLTEAAMNGLFNRREYCVLPESFTPDQAENLLGEMVHASAAYGALLAKYIFAE